MSDQRVGAVMRAVRLRRGWRQADVAMRAGVSASLVSLIERGHVGAVTLDRLRLVSATLDVRLDILPRWRGGELDRLLNSRHAAQTEAVARWLRSLGWEVIPEVSFSIGGERGLIDLFAWHAPTRTLLVVEIKTELVDVQELIGVTDRKTRLATRIARDRGWLAATVSTLVVMAEGSTNRRRVAAHAALIGSAYPTGGRTLRAWLHRPEGRIAAFTFFSNSNVGNAKSGFAGRKRVRRQVGP